MREPAGICLRVLRSGRRSGFAYAMGRLAEEAGNALHGLAALRAGGRLPCAPPLPGKDILILAGIQWRFRFQRPQQLAQALARAGCRVFYIAPGVAASARAGWRLQSAPATQPARLCLFSAGYGNLSALWEHETLAEGAARSLRCLLARLRAGGRDAAVIVQHPLWAKVAARLDGAAIIYDCLDDFADFDDAFSGVPEAERMLTRLCAGLVGTSAPLCARWKDSDKARACIRNGCDYGRFAAAAARPAASAGKIIGYHGAIAEWFDADLIRALALALPRHTLLLAGGDTVGVGAKLRDLPNVRLTGEVPYARLAGLVASFDVGLVPFKIRSLTLGTNPVKVYEYLAAGKPVVATPLPEMEQFGALVRVGAGEAFIRSVQSVLLSPPAPALLQAFAARQTWDARAGEFLAFIDRICR